MFPKRGPGSPHAINQVDTSCILNRNATPATATVARYKSTQIYVGRCRPAAPSCQCFVTSQLTPDKFSVERRTVDLCGEYVHTYVASSLPVFQYGRLEEVGSCIVIEEHETDRVKRCSKPRGFTRPLVNFRRFFGTRGIIAAEWHLNLSRRSCSCIWGYTGIEPE